MKILASLETRRPLPIPNHGMVQCEFSQGSLRTIGWIERGPYRVGSMVELKGKPGRWRVERVGKIRYPLHGRTGAVLD